MFRAARQIQRQHAAAPQIAPLQVGHYGSDLATQFRIRQGLFIADQRRSRLWVVKQPFGQLRQVGISGECRFVVVMAIVSVIDKARRGDLQIAVLAHLHHAALQGVQHRLHLFAVQRLLGVIDAQLQIFVGVLRQTDVDRDLRCLGQAVVVADRCAGRQRLPAQAVGENDRQRRGALAAVQQLPRQIDAGKRQVIESAQYVVLQCLRTADKGTALARITHGHKARGVAERPPGSRKRHRHAHAQFAVGGPLRQRIEDHRRKGAVAQQRMGRAQA